jgi:hypothetical protein
MSSVDDPLARILPLLRNVKQNGAGYTALCPSHDDCRQNSLSIRRGDDDRALLHCFVGCEPERIVATLGLSMADLFPPRTRATFRRNGAGRHRNGEGEGASVSPGTTATAQHAGLTLAQYAAAKQLDPERLRAFGLSDFFYLGTPAVRIAYRDTAGNEAAVRFRLRLEKSPDGDARFKGRKGAKVCLYGLDRLALARERGPCGAGRGRIRLPHALEPR